MAELDRELTGVVTAEGLQRFALVAQPTAAGAVAAAAAGAAVLEEELVDGERVEPRIELGASAAEAATDELLRQLVLAAAAAASMSSMTPFKPHTGRTRAPHRPRPPALTPARCCPRRCPPGPELFTAMRAGAKVALRTTSEMLQSGQLKDAVVKQLFTSVCHPELKL